MTTKYTYFFYNTQNILANSDISIRLLAGEDALSGIIELSIRGEWRSVCDDQWDDNDARVACRQLGLPNASKLFVYTLTLLLISE